MGKLIEKALSGIIGLFALSSCLTMPKGAVPVKPFEAKAYLGKWYEIARFDFRFERNLNQTTAYYSMNEDGSIRVENRGYDYKKHQWKQAVGKAKLAGASDEGRLKVSFFGPFYGAYNVIALDSQYTYALVAGKNLNYLWILSREKTLPESTKQAYLRLARELGYKTDKLVWVDQEPI
ncbi:MAG: lipocalin family protein [Bacteroidota bacterium]|nr:lipocalin family protein [Bacteroidota bacterium]